MSKHFSRKPATPSVQPVVDPQDIFTKEQLETILRFLRRKVVLSTSIRMETAGKDLQAITMATQAVKQIEGLAISELQKLSIPGKPAIKK